VVALCERDGQATIAALRDELGTSRRYAQALLEHLDRTKVTRRDGDVHVLRRRRQG
jgi:selenocysteine-specific elongation factor